MSHRKQLGDVRKNLTAAEQEIRRKQEAKVFALGVPLCPEHYIYNSRPLYALWKKNVERLLKARLLSFSDGDALLTWCRAELNGQKEVLDAIWNATWAKRPAFPEPVAPPGHNLADFIQGVARE